MGHGWWCWIIPLRGGDVSAGIVYDSRIFALPEGANLGERLHSHIRWPIRSGAKFSAKRRSSKTTCTHFPRSRTTARKFAATAGPRWATRRVSSIRFTVPGLDFCSYTSYYVSDLVARNLAGEDVSEQHRLLQRTIPDHVSVVVRDVVQGQVLLHGRRRTDVGRVAARCRNLFSRPRHSGLQESGARVRAFAIRRKSRPLVCRA